MVRSGETLRFNGKELEYYAHNLTSLLNLYCLAQPARSFKFCLNPNCTHRFILSHDAKVKLCGSKECLRWNNARHQSEHRDKD
jgi:hypothetical protein